MIPRPCLGLLPSMPMPRPCDACYTATALLFCRADAAFLCMACDFEVHSVNKLASRHERVVVCEVCENAPASVTCKADAAALCLSCDADIHSVNNLASRHERIPIAAQYTGAAPSSDSSNEDVDKRLLSPIDRDSVIADQTWFLPSVENDLMSFDFDKDSLDTVVADCVVPVLDPFNPDEPLFGTQLLHDVHLQLATEKREHILPTSLDVGVVPDVISSHDIESVASFTAQPKEREARVLRYKEKKKNRRFEKTIRYASRKAYAESRPRIKGKFVKRSEVKAEEGSSALLDNGFGVVPSWY